MTYTVAKLKRMKLADLKKLYTELTGYVLCYGKWDKTQYIIECKKELEKQGKLK